MSDACGSKLHVYTLCKVYDHTAADASFSEQLAPADADGDRNPASLAAYHATPFFGRSLDQFNFGRSRRKSGQNLKPVGGSCARRQSSYSVRSLPQRLDVWQRRGRAAASRRGAHRTIRVQARDGKQNILPRVHDAAQSCAEKCRPFH